MKRLLRNYFLLILLPALFVFSGEKANAQTATFTTRTGGLQPTGNGNPITQGQTQVPLIGFSISVSGGSITFKNFNISSNRTLDNYIANGTLYRSTTNGGTYNPASKGTPVGTATISGSNISIDNLLETVSSTEVYYFFVADAIYNNASIEYNGQIYINSGNFATDINNNNNYQYYSNYRGYTWSAGSSPYPLSVANNTTGLSSTATNLTASMTDRVLFAFSVKNNSSTTRTISNVNINSNLAILSNYFTNLKLYTNTSNSYSTTSTGGTATASGSSGYANISLTTNNTITAGSTRWFWFVADRTSTAFSSTSVQFNFQSGQSSSSIITSGPVNFNTATIFGSTYNINYSNITITPTTGLTGLKANGSTLTAKETDVVAFGFTMTSTTAITVSQFNINSNNSSIGTYFGNGRIYYINSATYTTGSRGTAVGTVAFSGNYATVTMSSANTFTANQTRYYYVVMDNIAPASTTTSVAFNFTSGQSANAVTITAPGASTFNTFTGSGNSLTLPSPTIYVNTNTNGLNTAAITQGQTDIVLYGFSVEAFGAHTFTNFRIRTSGSENGYFSNARLIKSTSSTFPGVSSPAYSGVDVCGCGLVRASVNETVPSGTTYYYWLVADYTVSWGPTPVSNYSFNFQSGQGEAAFQSSSPNTSYNNITTTANSFAIGGVYDWAGNVSTSFTTAGNWRINGNTPGTAPGANDLVRIGVNGYQWPYNQPSVNVGTLSTVGKMIFGTNNTPVLTITNGFGSTFTVTSGIIVNANATPTISSSLVYLALPVGSTSSIAAGATLTMDQGSLNLDGTMSIAGTFTHANALTNGIDNSGTITLTGSGAINEARPVVNSGAITHSGTGAITFGNTLTNTGTFTAGGNFSLTGALTNNSPATLTLGTGTNTFSSTVGNAAGATITLGSGGTTFTGAVTNAGTITGGSGAVSIPNNFNNSASGAVATLDGAGTKTISGTLANATGATFTLGGGATSVNGAITNNGTFTAGSGNIAAASDFTNAGTFNGGSGTHDFNGTNFTNSGTYNLSSGTTQIVATTFANSGTVVSNGAGTVNFDRAGAQAINNTNTSTTAPASVAFNNLTLSGSGTKTLNSTGTGKFSVAPSGTLTVSSGITFAVAGAAGTNNSLTLLSDASGSAQVAAITAGQITGQLSVERYISGGDKKLRSYRLLSSPVSQSATTPFYINFANFAQANAASNLNGNNVYTGGPGTGFSITQTTPSIYLYDERAVPAAGFNAGKTKGITQLNTGTTPTTVNIAAGTSLGTGIVTNQNVPIGNGFMIYNVGHTGQTTPNLTSSTPQAYKITQKGYLNQGSIPVTLWFTPTGGAGKLSYTSSLTAPGYNMLGNPYASTLDLTAFVNANSSIESYIYQLGSDNTGGQAYVAWNRGLQSSPDATRYVASGQGFFVKAKTTNSTVTFTELQKASGQNPTGSFFMSTDPLATEPVTGFYIKMEKDIENYDHCGIYFGKDYSDNYLKEEDALDIDGASPKVYMSSYTADGRRTAINASAGYKDGKTIKLYINAIADGTYTLRIQEIKNFDPNYDIWLVDNLKSDSVNFTATDNYAFDITRSDATTFGGERFKLVIKRKPLPPYKFLSLKGQVAGRAINLTWTTENEGSNVGFTVERLNANRQYEPLKYFVSTGAGTYNFIDNTPTRGVNVYRIKQDDIDHKISYSKELSLLLIDGNTKDKKFELFPNPVAADPLNVKFITEVKGSVKITVVNAAGYVMLTSTTTQQQTTIDVSSLKSGVYFVKAVIESTGEAVGSESFIKL